MAMELDSDIVATRGSSPPVALNSAQPKDSNLSFLVTIAWILVTIDRWGQFGGSASKSQFAGMDDNRVWTLSL